jgi:hypothetical protein
MFLRIMLSKGNVILHRTSITACLNVLQTVSNIRRGRRSDGAVEDELDGRAYLAPTDVHLWMGFITLSGPRRS